MDRPPIAEALAKLSLDRADASQIAFAVCTAWLGINAALSPIIGELAVTALFERFVDINKPNHPWLLVAKHAANTY